MMNSLRSLPVGFGPLEVFNFLTTREKKDPEVLLLMVSDDR